MPARAEERALEWREQAPGAGPAMTELAQLLGVQNLQESMLRVTESLERSTKLFRNSPDFAIPEVRFSQIEDGRFPYYVTRQVKRRGVLVVRGVVPSDTALRWQDSLLEYLETNGVSGPPGARDVFWSRAQAQARENLGVRQVLAALNRLWKPDPSTPVDLTKSLSFCDRAFVGNPTSSSLMGRHAAVMAGGPGASQRWLSPHHSQAYRDIFGGRWEDWDPFMAGPRMRAAEASSSSSWAGDDSAATPGGLVGGVPGGGETPQPFRPFQGYLSFGRWGEVGNVHVVPTMKAATAFTLLRPFMDDAFEADAGDADWLCGAGQGQELPLSPKWHQPILDALVRLPPLLPGDAVFWHADTIHCDADAVVPHEGGGAEGVFVRGGTGDSSGARGDPLATPKFGGVHLSSLPVCEANSTYVKAQREAFAEGVHPPGFSPVADGGGKGEGGFVARASREELTREGRRAMGLRRYTKEHYNPALEVHHRLLEIAYKW